MKFSTDIPNEIQQVLKNAGGDTLCEYFLEAARRLVVLDLMLAGLVAPQILDGKLVLSPAAHIVDRMLAPLAPPKGPATAGSPTADSPPRFPPDLPADLPAGAPELQKQAGEENQAEEADAVERGQDIWASLPGKGGKQKLAAARDYIARRLPDPLALDRFLKKGQAPKTLAACTEAHLRRLVAYVDQYAKTL